MSSLSGRAWCAQFPTSKSLDDLIEPFRGHARAFIDRLKSGGVTVSISATYRPAERAYLMHHCCKIASGEEQPAVVPAMAGVDIDWTHGGNSAAAKQGAREMMEGYEIQYPAALVSRHTQRRAVDMTIHVPAGALIRDNTGEVHKFAAAADGQHADVIHIGATFSVLKLKTDPPHWSDDGH